MPFTLTVFDFPGAPAFCWSVTNAFVARIEVVGEANPAQDNPPQSV